MAHPILENVISAIISLGEAWEEDFENFRDELHEIPPEHMSEVMDWATESHPAQLLFATVLADVAYPPAVPLFLAWLDTGDDDVKFAAVCALDSFADGQYESDRAIVDSFINAKVLDEVANEIKVGWKNSPPSLPTFEEWSDQFASQPKYTETEKLFNLIELNPEWVVLGDGSVLQPNGPLPANQGTHLLSGTAVCAESATPNLVVLAVDSSTGVVTRVSQKRDNQWRDVTAVATSVVPRHSIEQAR